MRNILLFSSLLYSFCFGQVDPYYNRQLNEYFNPQQIDFSKEYFDLQSKQYSKDKNQLQQSLSYDYSSIWLTENTQQNGVIGLNYQRIQIHISKVTKSKNSPDTYLIIGKSKVNNNICNFSGEIKLINFFYTDRDNSEFTKCADLFASYVFYEDSTQNHSGMFKGIMECAVYLDKTKILLDESMDVTDGYWNRTFVGTWTDYTTQKSKKCIWGDYRLPFTFDFDCGDGEMVVCDKYVKNGWQTFNAGTEYISSEDDKWVFKDRWWIEK